MISPETFLDTYEEYLDKLSTGAVLGMVDQRWQFYYAIQTAYDSGNLRSYGCDYVPLPITIDKKVKNQYGKISRAGYRVRTFYYHFL